MIARPVLLALGYLSLTLGIVGIFLPILPTVPFLILAAYFFSKSSKKLHEWLLNHKTFGPQLRAWEENGAVSKKSKLVATVSILGGFLFQIFVLELSTTLLWILAITFAVVLIYIWSRPTAQGQK